MRKLWRILFGIILFTTAGIYTINLVKNYIDLQEQVDLGIAVKTKATITGTTSHYNQVLHSFDCTTSYEYMVDEIRYTDSNGTCPILSYNGREVTVYYDSRNPDIIITDNGFELWKYSIFLLYPIGVRMIYIGIKKYPYL